ncbi:hypothetical protein [Acidovorax sp. CCYZU-2555]|uniref:hypothetical protein n=1 Tax=Acidovorax sp. CCYZU-2555 TaxID=2835042 RepID=UPI001BCF0235|nr:hypothetical protein [Acidovorax sp. CCYZU-2555]MBS7780917.1 hypothetical protein [Acidovorax sp. CCYZU-2555]
MRTHRPTDGIRRARTANESPTQIEIAARNRECNGCLATIGSHLSETSGEENMKLGAPASKVALAHVEMCTMVGRPPSTSKKLKSKYSISYSRFNRMPKLHGTMPVDYIGLVAAMVRTAAAGKVVSVTSTTATSFLADSVLQYLSSTAHGVSISQDFHELKDFVGTAYTGVLGAGLCYMWMLHDGYVWKAHYEEIVIAHGSGKAVPEPDFVFAKTGDIAIVESKGTGRKLVSAVTAAKNGYLHQVEPGARRALHGGIFASRGYAFGTALNTTIGAGSSCIEMACIFRNYSPPPKALAGCKPSVPVAPNPHQPLSAGLQLVRKANYAELYRQLGLDSKQIASVVQSLHQGDQTLFQSPHRFRLMIDGEAWTAWLALPFGIIRGIERGQYPEALAEAQRARGPTVVGGQDPSLIFVNFPDHSRVLFRKEETRDPHISAE